jgi:predicted DNA-binding transcriptional regulator AlpA
MDSSVEVTYSYLQQKYNRTVIGKKEMAQELNIASSTLDLYISKGIGLPKFKKLGTAKNARVIFNLYDIAVFLHTDQIETM